MKKYELFAKGERIVPFTPKEMDKIEKEFPDYEKPLHYVFRSGLRFNKETRDTGIVAISPHFVKLFEQRRLGDSPKLYGSFHMLDVELIAFSEDEFVLVKTRGNNLICTAKMAVRFVQILYRNYSLSMNWLHERYDLEVRCSNLDLFPDIDLYVSPTQKFQFAYFAFSSYYEQPYRHDVVRYMHSLICSMNPVIDLTRFPRGVFKDGEKIKPLVKALELVRYSLGICCENLECENLIDLLFPLLDEEHGLRLVHLKDCGIGTGFQTIKKKVEEDGSIHVGYWNLNGNPCNDFAYFARVLELSFSPVYFLGISNTDIDVKTLALLFNAIANNTYLWELKELQIAGLPIRDEAFDEFAGFLDRINRKKQNHLEAIDIGNVDGSIYDVFNLVIEQVPKLSVLSIAGNKIGGDLLGMLTSYIRDSNSLTSLDISGTSLDPDAVAEIILAFEENSDLTGVTLKMGRLGLNGTNLLPLFRAFLTGDKLADQKWRSLNFDGNDMTAADLRNLIPLLEQFPNLSDLSLAGNFSKTTTSPYIGDVLVELVGIKHLRKLNIAGDNSHKIGNDIMPMLSKLKLECQLTELDISNNDIGDGAFSVVIQLVGRSLERISLDGSGVKSIDLLMDFCLAVKKNEKMISVGFPTTDGMAIANTAKGRERELLEQRVGDIQISVATYVTSHRRKRNLPNELPFEPSREVLDMLNGLSGDFSAKLKGQNLYQHTCFSDELGIPMPFQRLGESSKDVQRRQQIPIGELEVYETESMKYIVMEDRTVNDALVLPTRAFLAQESQNQQDAQPPPRKHHKHKKPEEAPPKPKIRGLETVLLSDDKLDDLDRKRIVNQSAKVQPAKKSDKKDANRFSSWTGENRKDNNKSEKNEDERKRRKLPSSSSEDEPRKPSRKEIPKRRPKDPSYSSDDEPRKPSRKEVPKRRSKDLSYSSDDELKKPSRKEIPKRRSKDLSYSSEDEPKKPSRKEVPKRRSKDLSYSSEDEPRKPSRKEIPKRRSKDLSYSSEDEFRKSPRKDASKRRSKMLSSDEEEPKPRKPSQKNMQKRSIRVILSSSSDDEPRKPPKRTTEKPRQYNISSSDDEDVYYNKPQQKRSSNKDYQAQRRNDDYSDNDVPRAKASRAKRQSSYSDDEDSLVGWKQRSERKLQQMNRGPTPQRPYYNPGRSEFDAPSSTSSSGYNQRQPAKSSVRKVTAPELSPSMKPIPQARQGSSDEELVALPKGPPRPQRRRIELNSALDDTPPLTMARVPISHLFDKD